MFFCYESTLCRSYRNCETRLVSEESRTNVHILCLHGVRQYCLLLELITADVGSCFTSETNI